jgi:hypothetical protein
MPAYPDATVSLRSLAASMEADLDEVVRDAMRGNLNRYFTRTDQMISATPGVEPSQVPALEVRSNSEGAQADLVAAMNANRARRYPPSQPHGDGLVQLLARNRTRRYPPSVKADDGREYYARLRTELTKNTTD